jgi:palmitoyl-protein thioesterase
MSDQGDEGCAQLKRVKELEGGVRPASCKRSEADEIQFDAMGFSQGGLYLRHYAQYCNDPPIRNLITVSPPSAKDSSTD